MPVTDITKDVDARTLTITAEFAAPVERVWALYADPRQLEQVWGPPEYPATFVDHDLRPGGRMTYYMTSPEGEKFAGYWDIDEVDEPHRLHLPRRLRRQRPRPQPRAAGLAERLRVQRDGRRHPCRLHEPLRLGRRHAEGARHGHGGGRRTAINQIDGFLANTTQNA